MARLITMLNLQGIYTSPPITIPLVADGAITKIDWTCHEPNGSQIFVQTKLSLDGVNWTEWKTCTNGGQIADVDEDSFINNLQLIYRVIIKANAYGIKPKLNSLSLIFEPVLVFDNKGDVNCSPEIWITKINNGDFSLINLSHNNQEFKLTGLIDNETVYIDNENQDILTDLVATYRYKDFNDNYLSFPPGKNILRINGSANIKFKYQFKLL